MKAPGFQKKSYRSAEHRLTKKLQQPRRRNPPPVPPREIAEDDDDDGDYQNAPPLRQEKKGGGKHVSIGSRQSLVEDDFQDKEATAVE